MQTELGKNQKFESDLSHEVLQADKKSQSLLWLLSVPGTTSHMIINRKKFDEVKKLFSEGKSMTTNLEWERNLESSEPYLSLHIALSQEISTIFSSDFSYLYPYTPKYAQGFILKPEFFLEKIGATSDEEIIQATKNDPENEYLHYKNGSNPRSFFIAKNIWKAIRKEGANVELAWAKAHRENSDSLYKNKLICHQDYGIRALTIKESILTPVPITPEDILYIFEVELLKRGPHILLQSPIVHKVKLFYPNGEEIKENEWETLLQKTEEFNSKRGHNIWDHYRIYRDS